MKASTVRAVRRPAIVRQYLDPRMALGPRSDSDLTQTVEVRAAVCSVRRCVRIDRGRSDGANQASFAALLPKRLPTDSRRNA
jgi:hypothetical protein